ncbi:MAG: twin-arginine translocase subunit TatB [Nitrospirae bacterium]|nr:twin-arginine translocase subunit TatB [Nitrospirota bacterium]
MFDIGFQELVIIFIVGLLVVGPEKLPELGRTAGKWMIEIRKGISAVKMQVDREFKEVDVSADRPADHVIRDIDPEALTQKAETAEAVPPKDDIARMKEVA